MDYKVSLLLTPQVEDSCAVTSPLLPELVKEWYFTLENVKDALAAVLEIYQDQGRPLPQTAVT